MEGREPPKTYRDFVDRFPALAQTHEQVAAAVEELGPLDEKVRALVKLGICLGAGLESALRSHVRRARRAGASDQEIEQALMLGMNTIGFPRTVAGWSWARCELERAASEPRDSG